MKWKLLSRVARNMKPKLRVRWCARILKYCSIVTFRTPELVELRKLAQTFSYQKKKNSRFLSSDKIRRDLF